MKKSDRNIKKTITALRVIIDESKDPYMIRMAYFAENTLRWAMENTVGWDRPEVDLIAEVSLLKIEVGK